MEERLEDMKTDRLKLEHDMATGETDDAMERQVEIEDEMKRRGLPVEDRDGVEGLADFVRKAKGNAMHKEECECECLFCTLECPDCGSTDIEVYYAPEFKLVNSEAGPCRRIRMKVDGVRHMVVRCHDCDLDLDLDLGEDEDEDDPRLHSLQRAIFKTLDLCTEYKLDRNEDGAVEVSAWRAEYRRKDAPLKVLKESNS